ncbi:kinase-like domain-containing protein, partial [Tanacetum coccineum]
RFLKVSYNQLLKATDGFSTANLIGEGGCSVYKGILHSDDDRLVAVKVLHLVNRGAHKSNDFKALVYDFMPNGSVHDWLHSIANTMKLNLVQRINILKDVATALDYLHNRCQSTIFHGDLKPSNILLDDDMVAHVGDFGLARLLGAHLNQNSLTGVKGTIGYAPPEYGIGSEMKSSGDVYSFGILLLELMTGKKPTDDMFNEGLSIYKFASMALPDHVIDVIDDDVNVLQSTEANAKKWKNVWLQLSRLEYHALYKASISRLEDCVYKTSITHSASKGKEIYKAKLISEETQNLPSHENGCTAKRVAEKMETELGDLGGYAICFEDVTGHSTKT